MKTAVCYLSLLIVALAAEPTSAEVIGGSVLRSPPQFMSNSFFAFTPTFEVAFPFQVIAEGQWLPDRLAVPLFHYQELPGGNAVFSICSDASGVPGSKLMTFSASNITTDEQIVTAMPLSAASTLQGNTTYWLVGSTGSGQVNWNLETTTGAYRRAYRVNHDSWIGQSVANTSAFTLYGSAVPEPSALALLACAASGLLACAWRNRTRSSTK